MIKFDVLKRWSSEVQFTAEIDCAPNACQSVKLGLAVRWAIDAKADLRGADLRGADLYGANLYGANLRGADLGTQWIIPGPTRSDGYQFFLQKLNGDDEPKVKAGCRMFTITEAQSHWTATRGGTPLGDETEAIVRCLCSLARSRGLIG